MEIVFRTQRSHKISELFRKAATTSDQLLIATAYLTEGGLKQMGIPDNAGVIKIICGVHGCVSDLHLLRKLVNSHNDSFQANIFVGSNVFHTKLYVFTYETKATLFCGSANCTGQGFDENEEALIEVRGDQSDPVIAEAIDYFNFLWTQCSVPVVEYLKAHPDYAMQNISNFTHQQRYILQNLKLELETLDKNCESHIHKSLQQRHYSKFVFLILLGQPKSKWLSGEDICKAFDAKCSRGEVFDTNGNRCKGFAYDYLFNEVIGYKQGSLIECQSEVPRERNRIFPAYKSMHFRIKVDCYTPIQNIFKNHF